MPARFDVLAIGELNPDLILSGFSVAGPVLGTEQSFDRQTLTLGSSTAIACVLMQRLGLRTAMTAMVGDDEYGRFCLDALQQNGVDTQGVRIATGRDTGVTISLSYQSDRLLLTRYSTMTEFGANDIDKDLLSAARHLHVGSYFIQARLRPDLPDLFRSARARGQSTSLDLGWDPAGRWDKDILSALLPHVSLVFPNQVELASVIGTSDIANGLARLHDLGAQVIVLKLGRDGAMWSNRETTFHHSGFAVEVVDTTGAGDAFNAGFLRGWLNGESPQECLALGNACGAITVRGLGGVGGLNDLEQARAMMAGIGHPEN